MHPVQASEPAASSAPETIGQRLRTQFYAEASRVRDAKAVNRSSAFGNAVETNVTNPIKKIIGQKQIATVVLNNGEQKKVASLGDVFNNGFMMCSDQKKPMIHRQYFNVFDIAEIS